MVDIMEGSERVAAAIPEATTADKRKVEQLQEDFDKSNQGLFAFMFPIADKPAALLVTKHSEVSRGTQGDGQAAL